MKKITFFLLSIIFSFIACTDQDTIINNSTLSDEPISYKSQEELKKIKDLNNVIDTLNLTANVFTKSVSPTDYKRKRRILHFIVTLYVDAQVWGYCQNHGFGKWGSILVAAVGSISYATGGYKGIDSLLDGIGFGSSLSWKKRTSPAVNYLPNSPSDSDECGILHNKLVNKFWDSNVSSGHYLQSDLIRRMSNYMKLEGYDANITTAQQKQFNTDLNKIFNAKAFDNLVNNTKSITPQISEELDM